MNARTARRKRIIRVRTVEHQMAEANLARANGELKCGAAPGHLSETSHSRFLVTPRMVVIVRGHFRSET